MLKYRDVAFGGSRFQGDEVDTGTLLAGEKEAWVDNQEVSKTTMKHF